MTIPSSVSDSRSNAADQVAHAVDVLGKSKDRKAVFETIYRGKKAVKSVNEIANTTGLSRIRVLQEGKRLADNQIVGQLRLAGATYYRKDKFYGAQKQKILRLARDPIAFSQFPTKTRPRAAISKTATIVIRSTQVKIRFITIDDIDSFLKVRLVKVPIGEYTKIAEKRFKKGVAKILGEKGKFVDWGGEGNDLYTSKVVVCGKRILTAFAFKGPGVRGPLTPKKMGKNGDQIQRLFKSNAGAYILHYWGQISESVVDQMVEFAKAKSAVEGQQILYGIVDGDDANRLRLAYPKAFN